MGFVRGRHVVGLALVAAVGCSSPFDPVSGTVAGPADDAEAIAGQATAQPGFYPLQIGNRWHHRAHRVIRFVMSDGKQLPLMTNRWEIPSEVVCARQVNGVDYLVERSIVFGSVVWTTERQDATGLYTMPSVVNPPACPVPTPGFDAGPAPPVSSTIASSLATWPPTERAAVMRAIDMLEARSTALHGSRATLSPSDQQPWERARLRYPLEIGTQWQTWEDATARLAGFDLVTVPAGKFEAVRVSVAYPTMGPRDHVNVWYGRAGYLRTTAHYEFPVSDGRTTGVLFYDLNEELTQLWLVPKYSAAPAPWTRF